MNGFTKGKGSSRRFIPVRKNKNISGLTKVTKKKYKIRRLDNPMTDLRKKRTLDPEEIIAISKTKPVNLENDPLLAQALHEVKVNPPKRLLNRFEVQERIKKEKQEREDKALAKRVEKHRKRGIAEGSVGAKGGRPRKNPVMDMLRVVERMTPEQRRKLNSIDINNPFIISTDPRILDKTKINIPERTSTEPLQEGNIPTPSVRSEAFDEKFIEQSPDSSDEVSGLEDIGFNVDDEDEDRLDKGINNLETKDSKEIINESELFREPEGHEVRNSKFNHKIKNVKKDSDFAVQLAIAKMKATQKELGFVDEEDEEN
jgi:hypothetical protein